MVSSRCHHMYAPGPRSPLTVPSHIKRVGVGQSAFSQSAREKTVNWFECGMAPAKRAW